MGKYFKPNGDFTSEGAKKFGFQKGNQYGKKIVGNNHGKWKGGFKYYKGHSTTYRWIRIGIGKYMAEHRYVMEQYLGRKLTSKEAIHHIDGNGLNNSITNLQLVNWGQHANIHKGSYFYENAICKCGNTKVIANGLCNRCYCREYARNKYGYKRRYV